MLRCRGCSFIECEPGWTKLHHQPLRIAFDFCAIAILQHLVVQKIRRALAFCVAARPPLDLSLLTQRTPETRSARTPSSVNP
jgi:hypothetical protein